MGAQWKQAGRVANSTKRGALIGKLVKEIMVAAKMGDPIPKTMLACASPLKPPASNQFHAIPLIALSKKGPA